MTKIGYTAKPKSSESKYAQTGVIYLLGMPMSIGLKKNDKGGYDVECFGLIGYDKTPYNKPADKGSNVKAIKPDEL